MEALELPSGCSAFLGRCSIKRDANLKASSPARMNEVASRNTCSSPGANEDRAKPGSSISSSRRKPRRTSWSLQKLTSFIAPPPFYPDIHSEFFETRANPQDSKWAFRPTRNNQGEPAGHSIPHIRFAYTMTICGGRSSGIIRSARRRCILPMAVVTFATVQKNARAREKTKKRQRRNDGAEHSTL